MNFPKRKMFGKFFLHHITVIARSETTKQSLGKINFEIASPPMAARNDEILGKDFCS